MKIPENLAFGAICLAAALTFPATAQDSVESDSAAESISGVTVTGEVTAPGPEGDLAGTLISAGDTAPLAIIIPGSGPTNRDGNSPAGLNTDSYKLLAEGLAEYGISSVRIDKRGMYGSSSAVADANKVTMADYAADLDSWADSLTSETGLSCVWLAGHSEGALVAMIAAQGNPKYCGVVSLAGPGRKAGIILREQIASAPGSEALIEPANEAMTAFERGDKVSLENLPVPLQPLFHPIVQDYLIDLLSHDPAKLAASLPVPLLILQGERDIQVKAEDAQILADANGSAEMLLYPNMTHTLKDALSEERSDIMETYTDPAFPVTPELIEVISDFLHRERGS